MRQSWSWVLFASSLLLLGGMILSDARANSSGGIAPPSIHAIDMVLTLPYAPHTPGLITGMLQNNGDAADRLLSAVSPLCERAEIHTMTMEAGIMKMRPLTDGLPLDPGVPVSLSGTGVHIMCFGAHDIDALSEMPTITFSFEKAPAVTIPVSAVKASSKPAPDSSENGAHHTHHP